MTRTRNKNKVRFISRKPLSGGVNPNHPYIFSVHLRIKNLLL